MVDSVGPLTLGDLWAWLASEHGDDPFLTFVDQDGDIRRATYARFDAEINQAANLLAAYGVSRGDNVILQLPSSPGFLSAQLALAKLGVVAVPVNLSYTPGELEYIATLCEATVAIVAAETAASFVHLPGLKTLFVVGELEDAALPDVPDDVRVVCVCERRQHAATFTPDPAITSLDPAMMLFTSGTTAAPKGVVITHAACFHAGLYHNWQLAMSASDRMLTSMPMEHSNFQLAALMPVLTSASEIVVVQRYSARRFWRQVREHHATLVQAVATMVKTLLLQPEDPLDAEHQVRDIQYYLALDDAAKTAFEHRFGTRLLNCYGLTETISWVITDLPFGPRRWPSIGRVGLGYEARVVDDDGVELPAGAVGEIQVKGVPGRTLMLGYYKDPEATARTFTADGWFRTKDRGYVDDGGWFYFAGRSQDLIKRSGRNISAPEVEKHLLAHPGVADAAVIGIPDEIRDEAVRAFVIPEPGVTLDPAEVIAFVAGRIAAYKVPCEVVVVQALPRTSTGKVAKRLLDHSPTP